MDKHTDFRPPVGTRVKLQGGETGKITQYQGDRLVEIEADAGGTWPATVDQLIGYADEPARCDQPDCDELAANVATRSGRARWEGELSKSVDLEELQFCATHTPTGDEWTVHAIAPRMDE